MIIAVVNAIYVIACGLKTGLELGPRDTGAML